MLPMGRRGIEECAITTNRFSIGGLHPPFQGEVLKTDRAVG